MRALVVELYVELFITEGNNMSRSCYSISEVKGNKQIMYYVMT